MASEFTNRDYSETRDGVKVVISSENNESFVYKFSSLDDTLLSYHNVKDFDQETRDLVLSNPVQAMDKIFANNIKMSKELSDTMENSKTAAANSSEVVVTTEKQLADSSSKLNSRKSGIRNLVFLMLSEIEKRLELI